MALAVAFLAALSGWLLSSRPVAAHPLGNFTINRYARLEPGASAIRIVYAVDMAEIPTFQEMAVLDRDGNKTADDTERAAYLEKKTPELARGLRLTVAGTLVTVRPEPGATLSFGEGQGGLPLLRLDLSFVADLPESARSGEVAASFRDTNYDDRLGWREIVVRGTAAAVVRQSTAPPAETSDMLRSYPEDVLKSPLDIREAAFSFAPGVAGAAPANAAATVAARTNQVARPGLLQQFANSAARKDLSLPIVLFSLLAAMFWGAVHALGPGHGKTVVAAYLVGSRGTGRHAFLLGLTVTATHTLSTYLLGIITLTASAFILPERLYPILSLVSGLMVVILGINLLTGRLRAGGIWPFRRRTPTAGATHAGPRAHQHHGGSHAHGQADHGHSHALPGADGRPVSFRSLLALGMYGGMIPCPTAIVVLLTSISLNRLGFGLLLVVSFSVGLALVLVGIGLMLVYAGRSLSRFSSARATGSIARVLPVASALAVIVAGVLITLRAAGQNGIPSI